MPLDCRYVEIYNEQIKDLLNPESGHSLDVREAPGRGTFVSGAANVEVCELARRVHAVRMPHSRAWPRAPRCREELLLRAHARAPSPSAWCACTHGMCMHSQVTSSAEVEELLVAGNEYRTTESTQLNMVSRPEPITPLVAMLRSQSVECSAHDSWACCTARVHAAPRVCMLQVSSRSHAVLQLRVRLGDDGPAAEGKRSLIDLVGSALMTP